jgi:RNA 3'-terminal phosphate cyclase (ATP)
MQGARLEIDGSHGEGGGQILRTALTLAAETGRAVHFHDIRARRRVPGLAASHLTSVRAAAAICGARLEGDGLGSTELLFEPGAPVRAGSYHFDISAAREGVSAGAACLVLQTVLLPLCLARGPSEVVVEGGTHNPMSPPFDYLRDVWLGTLSRMGVSAEIELEAWGWYPLGGGRVRARLPGRSSSHSAWLTALDLRDRGPLRAIRGRAVAANLPAHIPERMVRSAEALLLPLGCEFAIAAESVAARCAGAGIFLTAVYGESVAGFSAVGQRGKPSEEVAQEAALALIAHHRSSAALDPHLGDQLLVPAALADGPSRFTVHRVSRHLRTNAWVIERFGLAEIAIEEREDGTGLVTVTPTPPG